jgi:hypothetical protein
MPEMLLWERCARTQRLALQRMLLEHRLNSVLGFSLPPRRPLQPFAEVLPHLAPDRRLMLLTRRQYGQRQSESCKAPERLGRLTDSVEGWPASSDPVRRRVEPE